MKNQHVTKLLIAITTMSLLPYVATANDEIKTEAVQPTQVAVLSVSESSSKAQRETTCTETISEHVRRTVVEPQPSNNTGQIFDRKLVGSVLGGVAGGSIGSQFGKGNGRTAAAATGAIIGAIAGDRLSTNTDDTRRTVRAREEWVVVERLVEQPCIKIIDVPGYTVNFSVDGEIRSVFVEKSATSYRYR